MDKKRIGLVAFVFFIILLLSFIPYFLDFMRLIDCLFLFVVNILCCCLGMYIKKKKSGKND